MQSTNLTTPTTQTLIEKLHKSARNAHNAKNRAQRDAAQAFLIKRADELRERRDVLAQKLERRWEWLDANDPKVPYENEGGGQHTDQFLDRERRTIDLLQEYELICEALDDALVIWLHEESEDRDAQRVAAAERLVA